MTSARPAVFDTVPRENGTPAQYEESSFAFLNRVAGAFWEHPRGLIEEWVGRLPSSDDHADIRARLRSGDNRQFNSAFLELYLHELLLRTGHAVTLHPVLPHTSRRPDFYAEKDGIGFFVEAVVPAWSDKRDAIRSRRNRFYDVVNRLDSPNFILMIRSLKQGSSDAPAARLRGELRAWLAGLDPDSVLDLDSAPRYQWAQDDWAAEFSVIPKKREARGGSSNDRRAIGVYADEPAGIVNDAETIRKALASKDREYGDLGRPFVIAVGLFIFDRDHWHSMNAFYGHEAIEWSEGGDETRAFRKADGYFGAPGRWKNENVSGVLLVNQLQPYHVQKAEVTVWHHPNPRQHMPPSIQLPGEVVAVVDNKIGITRTPIVPAELLGLPEPWPPGEPWPHGT